MIIDAHNHPNYLGYDCDKILQNMAESQIDQTWLLSLETPATECSPHYYRVTRPDSYGPVPFSSCLECVQAHPDKFVLGYAPDPRLPESLDRLAGAIDLYGVKVCGEIMLRMMYDNPDSIRLFQFCGEKRLPVIVEVNYGIEGGDRYPWPGYWYGGGIEAFERTIQACPETIFLGHGPGFWAHISGDDLYRTQSYPQGDIVSGGKVTELMRSYPNLYCDLSAGSGLNALKRNESFTQEFLIEFQDRCVYGRDQYDNELQSYLNSLSLPAEAMRKIYAKNALRLLNP